ncbi:FHA domain-containing protein [Oceanispirochaeta sp.]|uniref:FHA domain-containing protein n=1 Tax=Oceanispirochaeta sp. TaxID=2035350 RepID=UPI002620588D|nr:FHA domain-containing protein [Oceanispirochaeta sp.]MDA3956514.1 FHA domain-containing protein [Oceanispirochaeta sp.]
MKDETIIQDSPVGRRLGKLGHKDIHCLLFNGKEIKVTSRMTIGRDKNNNFVINDGLVSRFHLEIQQIRGSYFVQDRNSSNGTWINGKRITPGKYIKLKQGDKLILGSRIEMTMI